MTEEPQLTIVQDEAVTPVLISLGVNSGFPGFNRFSVNAAAQYRFIGLNVKLAPTPAGLNIGGGLRGYLPIGGHCLHALLRIGAQHHQW